MIPTLNITAWSAVVPWSEPRQVEQDLIISRAIVALFSDPFLKQELRFRGGTALNKLHFPAPLRYSEDIDLVRATAGSIGPLLDRTRAVMEPWLGAAKFDQSPAAAKLRFRVPAEDDPGGQIRLKIEINIAEIDAYDPLLILPFIVQNPWFSGAADVVTFSPEEMLATKLRALLQRDKGRDLFDIDHALGIFPVLDIARVTDLFRLYLLRSRSRITRAEAEQRMFFKLSKPTFLRDMRPLLPPARAVLLDDGSIKRSFEHVMNRIIRALPGDQWIRSVEMAERFDVRIGHE